MAPKGKSSATSATRKKHARKAASTQGVVEEPQVPKEKKPKGKDKKSKKEPRKKVYVPPVKPAPIVPDPLDTLGLAQRLPAELVVVLRLLAKKDATTKRRALEDMQTAWIGRAKKGEEGEYLVYTLQEIIPVWLHHIPALFLHPSRRIRLQAIALHSSFLEIPNLRTQIFFQIREAISSDQAESILGSWCLAVHDVDRQVSSFARESWLRYVTAASPSDDKLALGATLLPRLWDFVQRTLLDPSGVYLYINPPQPMLPVRAQGGKKGSGRGTPVRRDGDASPSPSPSPRAKADEDEENEQDRKARLRVGAFGATEWVLNAKYTAAAAPSKTDERAEAKTTASVNEAEEKEDAFFEPLANPALWSSLYYGKVPPFVDSESFGFEQPVVRRSAWSLLQTLVQKCKAQLESLVPVLSSAILRSAWVEPDPNVRAAMWQPLLVFLKEHPNAWTLEAEAEKEDEEESGSDSDGEASKPPLKPSTSPTGPSQAYTEFLQFLATGCSGSPAQGYPTVLIILSTIPSSIVSPSSERPLEDLFVSFWAAVDARVLNSLDRVAASTAFFASVLESLVFVVRRVVSAPADEAISLIHGTAAESQSPNVDAAVKTLIQDQIKRAWQELSSGRLKVKGASAGTELAKTFAALYRLRADLFEAGWRVVAGAIENSVKSAAEAVPALVPELLQQFVASLERGTAPADAANDLLLLVVRTTLEECAALLQADEAQDARVASLVGILERFGELVFADDQMAKDVDGLVQSQTDRLLTAMPSLLLLYLKFRKDEVVASTVWHRVLETVGRSPEELDSTLPALLDAAESKRLPDYLRPQGEALHDAAAHMLSEALAGPQGATSTSLIGRLLVNYQPFISRSCREGLLHSLVDSFRLHFDDVLHENKSSVDAFNIPLSLLHDLIERDPSASAIESFASSLFPYAFLLAFLLPQVLPVDAKQQALAKGLWQKWVHIGSAEAKGTTLSVIKHLLRELLIDSSNKATPEHVLRTLSASSFGSKVDVLSDIFPSRAELDSMLEALPSTPLDPSLAVVDPLVPPSVQYRSIKVTASEFDTQGLAKYARTVHGLLLYLVDERQTAKESMWALHHILALAIYAEESSYLPGAQSPVFAKTVARATLQSILDRVQQLAAYLLSSATDEKWHSSVTNALVNQGPATGLEGVGQLVVDLVGRATRRDTVRESRVLHMILRHALSTATKADSEQWMLVARKIEKLAPHTSLAIIFSITRYAPEPTRLERFRNELAAGTLGIPASKANTEGLWLLRNLAASAPDPDSDVVFLPQQRAINLIKACQQWITSDEDLEEDVQSEMTLVFASLVPILSNVPGGHWDLVFDVVENNLENSTLDDPSTYVTLSRTLQLFMIIEDFASSNKALKAIWDERRSAILTLIRDLVSLKLESSTLSTPLSMCRELALQIVQDLPPSLLTRDTLPKMCHLVTDGSIDVQRMAYQLLQEAAKKYTEELVIEAAVDTEDAVKPELPTELLNILQHSLNQEEGEEYGEGWFGQILAWMVTFDLFHGASMKVKSGYIDQLKDLDLVGSRLLPVVFGLLDLYGGMAKAFKLEIWDVDEFYLDYYTTDTPISLRLLTAHLYYRALLLVPSLIRAWLNDCRDRQLHTTVTAYTSRHFSPAIIRTELERVKDPSTAQELVSENENITIKVANAVNEVTAAYAVDEQKLELTIKLPADWPLHAVDIRDSRLVGVTEDRWRAWVLGVRQILTFRSGSIVDGLSFFLKNVTSHFAGIAECAICYSIVNPTDGSLPRKPCKTCKNRFHAACLYKWFNTSHSSSCPLCRSEIMTGK
ncbi:hypothetical protein DICSQDRAFT_145362 [Dichomitus squalens LYAD-421 SS1]|uniref:uncharacterized protein n=1 Tax=Dichomitus squalens (strain LYAD-421) TaxID=732165 RepID=UPI0004410E03|nr:uncharacterized protein DICSQDRAFT_145362 [Dichomitus squalens LYAD-421 SS1]EJF63887.1 hypothetical protein DICSQDRAFT_145362 [Dichomitus squalens LYAD-421 SS1]